ncbi:16S rRNA (cytidine(1402)-2'-O)-methyltransferase [Oscillatoria sp. CS-180]|uniref:16S rRNA (cytidine(1402)-2'-O)-methyltransferase n=1 Tax=Oscillatoria sp. CS-180 TaxID=3021720 RepID=UPI00232EC5B1|nr:16S rRNA (cytidine(1402)-2'-O)-methyltransferase [Oscillatoria sp. CS-180]MDB9525475.1 16S rRNA (cytidine(1402)-2'-O)-methyltransferase [Oscillatoria sp. CS-180]
MTDSNGNGTLYIVGTPIGNLGDMTFRAIDTLQHADVIAAEDTRHTGKLLHHFQIQTPQMSYHAHNWRKRLPELTTLLQRGKQVALVSDAGMPGISDPGFELVEACVEADIPVVAIPGATAVVTALCVSGLPPQPFVFEGFLPTKGRDRRELINQIAIEHRTIVLYEAPHRLLTTLQDLRSQMAGDRRIAATRELTKQFEEAWRGTLDEAIAHYTDHAPKGEFTLVIAGQPSEPAQTLTKAEIEQRLLELLRSGLSRSQASRQLAQETGHSKREIYQIAVELPDV